MGTNFYWNPPEAEACPHCGRADNVEQLHIGKSALGWCFKLHVYPDAGIHDLDDWISRLQSGFVTDEYGNRIDIPMLLATITVRSSPSPTAWSAGDLAAHYALCGPNNLLRAELGPTTGCIGHGAGTWDRVVGEFS